MISTEKHSFERVKIKAYDPIGIENFKNALNIIENKIIVTQDDLQNELNLRGITATQSTVSRDIKELRLVKHPASDGQYKYSLATSTDEKYMKYYAIFSERLKNEGI